MIKMIQVLLQDEKYALKEFDEKVVLFEGDLCTCPEEYIAIKKIASTGEFVVSEVHRNVEKIKIDAKKKEEAALYAVVIYKKLFDNIVNRRIARDIRNYLNSGDEKGALTYIAEKFEDSIYSINDEKPLKISLMYLENQVDVKFSGEYLAEHATLSRGYVVFYNYCEKLQHICLFCNEMEKKLNICIEREKILRLYILGHL